MVNHWDKKMAAQKESSRAGPMVVWKALEMAAEKERRSAAGREYVMVNDWVDSRDGSSAGRMAGLKDVSLVKERAAWKALETAACLGIGRVVYLVKKRAEYSAWQKAVWMVSL